MLKILQQLLTALVYTPFHVPDTLLTLCLIFPFLLSNGFHNFLKLAKCFCASGPLYQLPLFLE